MKYFCRDRHVAQMACRHVYGSLRASFGFWRDGGPGFEALRCFRDRLVGALWDGFSWYAWIQWSQRRFMTARFSAHRAIITHPRIRHRLAWLRRQRVVPVVKMAAAMARTTIAASQSLAIMEVGSSQATPPKMPPAKAP